MKFLFRHFLLLAVLFGFVGQGVAFASPPCAAIQQEQASVIAGAIVGVPDCALGQKKSDQAPAPCKDMKPSCLAMAGCAAIAGLNAQSPVVIGQPVLAASYKSVTTPALHGRVAPPDLHPPSFLG